MKTRPPLEEPKGPQRARRGQRRAPSRARVFRWSLWTPLRLLLLITLVTLIWCYAHDRLTPKSWATPISYGGERLFTFAYIKAASEWDYLPFVHPSIHRLGAPFTANWSDYPMYEKLPMFIVGVVARIFGLFQACNFAAVFSAATTAIAFYACCRLLRYRREWAFAGAILFAFTYYHTFCGLEHLWLSFSYTVPPGLLCCWLVLASKRMKVGSELFWICVGASLFMGLSNPYNLNMFMQLLILALVAHWFLHRRTLNLITGLACVGVAIAGFLAVNLETIIYQMRHGWNRVPVERTYLFAESTALKPMEMFLPPFNHRFAWLADVGRQYWTDTPIRGEVSSPYLGIIAIIAFIWLVVEFVHRLMRRVNSNRPKTPSETRVLKAGCPSLNLHAPAVCWILVYSVLGGLNCLLAFFGMRYFRAANRYSIFISAIALLFLASRMSFLVRRLGARWSWVLATVVTTVGLLDQLPGRPPPEQTTAIANTIYQDREFAEVMEAMWPQGSMVFQMPVMVFPEGGPVDGVGEYDMLRPYLYTKNLRFSFGSVRGRPREMWQVDASGLPADKLATTLEQFGFAGIYFLHTSDSNHTGQVLLQLHSQGYTNLIVQPRRHQVGMRLHPSATPVLPRWSGALTRYASGWLFGDFAEDGTAWSRAGRKARIIFYNDVADRPESVFNLSATIECPATNHVSIIVNGLTVRTEEFLPGQKKEIAATIKATPGNNTVVFQTDGELVVLPPPSDPNRPRVGFSMAHLRVTREENPF